MPVWSLGQGSWATIRFIEYRWFLIHQGGGGYLHLPTVAQIRDEGLAQLADAHATIRRRMPLDTETLQAICLECGAADDLTVTPSQGVQWQPRQTALPCAHPGRGETSYLWTVDVVPVQPWTCRVCLQTDLIVLGIRSSVPEGLLSTRARTVAGENTAAALACA
ncbi:hypothetical protein CFHF_17335 [Caulobacter flavus]|uniref:Uncharacterized protein n=1 Tax=Caulobacter flavus TaxID=1679497 RepID=A0A2N5CQM3_9CAUL|nr:hypothetical protein C1707_22170 [Caulobacter flavus]PLR10281.1 hypothetical protein CFHF_17335 [Caulobacter flavus]